MQNEKFNKNALIDCNEVFKKIINNLIILNNELKRCVVIQKFQFNNTFYSKVTILNLKNFGCL